MISKFALQTLSSVLLMPFSPFCFDHYRCAPVLCPAATPTLTYPALSPAHELDLLLQQIMFLFYVTRAAFEIFRGKCVDLSLATPALPYCYITFKEDTGAFFPRNSTTLTHRKNSDKPLQIYISKNNQKQLPKRQQLGLCNNQKNEVQERVSQFRAVCSHATSFQALWQWAPSC